MQYRSLRTAAQPTVEPVSVAEAKLHCRVDTDADDAYIAGLISAAREYVETYMDESLVHQQLVMRMDYFPVEISLPRPPMAATGTVSITYTVDETMQTAVLSQSSYRVDRDSTPGAIRTLYGGSWPSHLRDANSITVTWWAGRGDSGHSVSRSVRNAILMLVGHWYERRLAAEPGALNEVPFGVKALLDSQKWGSYR
jgi:uncharacterized phiE125 gp8 family phage protein